MRWVRKSGNLNIVNFVKDRTKEEDFILHKKLY